MFDISFTELLIIGVIALVVIGPERLPKVARTVGHLLGRAQRYVSDVKGDIQREVELDELKKMKEEMENAARDVTSSMEDTENSIRGSLDVKGLDDFADNVYQSNADTDATEASVTNATNSTSTPAVALAESTLATSTPVSALVQVETLNKEPAIATSSAHTTSAKVPAASNPDQPSAPSQEKML